VFRREQNKTQQPGWHLRHRYLLYRDLPFVEFINTEIAHLGFWLGTAAIRRQAV
jgi:hypothetical protein